MASSANVAAKNPRVVIVGGGFGGLNAAKTLAKKPVDVTVVDRTNHHLFQPLLYQVASAVLDPSDIGAPIRHILRSQANVEVLLATVKSVDVAGRRVVLEDGDLPYDYLILATGSTHSYFGRDDWAPLAPGLKTIEDAVEIRRRVLLAFEAAEHEADAAKRRAWMTFVIVGAGPTGAELAGAFTEIAKHALLKDFRHINPADARVVLLEGGDLVLPSYGQELAEKGRKQLEGLGVEVQTGKRVTNIDAGGVSIGDERIEARTVIWAAGVAASPVGKTLGAPTDKAGRVQVEPDLSIAGHPEVFVVGDLASTQVDGKPVPGVAPAAMQGGTHAAKNILRTIRGEPRLPFRYRDKGSLATIGRARGIADLKFIKLSGLLAWLAWLMIHVFFLIGFRNRLFVLMSWAWSYFTYERGARMIPDEPLRPVARPEPAS